MDDAFDAERDSRPDERSRASRPHDLFEWYVYEDHIAESNEQSLIIRELVSSLEELARMRGWKGVYIGADTFFAWVREQPLVKVSPDVYLLDDPPEPVLYKSWQTWRPGHRPPRWALEIVSDDWRKDYEHGPVKYAQLGGRELVLFDPAAHRRQTKNELRAPLSVFRRSRRGTFDAVYRGPGPAWSEQVACWLQIVSEGQRVSLRLSEDEQGDQLIPTQREARVIAEEQAAARILVRQLKRRFGSVPKARLAQIGTAREPDLSRWLDRVLDARAIADVFR